MSALKLARDELRAAARDYRDSYENWGPADQKRSEERLTAAQAAVDAMEAATGKLLQELVDATTGEHLRRTLAAYEATGDHDHGRGPIRPGQPCTGDDCWVNRARTVLASLADPS